MAMTQDLLLRLRDLKPQIKKRFKAKELQLFGSNVRGEQREGSDIDVLVDFEEGADLFDLVGLATFLEEQLQRRVDVVPKRALREEFRDSILGRPSPYETLENPASSWPCSFLSCAPFYLYLA